MAAEQSAYPCDMCTYVGKTRQQLGGHSRIHLKEIAARKAAEEAARQQQARAPPPPPTPGPAPNTSNFAPDPARPEIAPMMGGLDPSSSDTEYKDIADLLATPQAQRILALRQQQMQDQADASARAKAKAEADAYINARLAQGQAPGQPAAMPPPIGADGRTPPPPNAEKVDWPTVAKFAIETLKDIRNPPTTGPSLAEQVGNMAIEQFVANMSREGGKATGKRFVKVAGKIVEAELIDTGQPEDPVQASIRSRMAAEISARRTKDAAAAAEAAAKAARTPPPAPGELQH